MLSSRSFGGPIDPIAHAQTLLRQGQVGQAERLARRVVQSQPGNARAHALLAQIAERRGDTMGAMRGWLRAAELDTTDPAPMEALATILAASGRVDDALRVLNDAAERQPTNPILRGRVAERCRQLGALDAALKHLQRLATLTPKDAAPLARAGELLSQSGRTQEAIAYLQLALRRDPDLVSAWLSLALNRVRMRDTDGAFEAANRAAAVAPDNVAVHEVGGLVALRAAEMQDARTRFDRAIATEPDRPVSLWGRAAAVPILAASVEHERDLCDRYAADLHEAAAAWDRKPDAPGWLDAVQTAFPRHYHGGDCMDEQRAHGRFLSQVMARAVPGLTAPRPSGPDQPIRVAFVSAYFYHHTISKLFRGWMEDLDRSRFTVVGVSLNHRTDPVTADLQATMGEWVDARGALSHSIRALASVRADVIIFPELGMDAATLRLAALRFAPVQMMAWGHPVTSGLPTIDCFLSSAAMAVTPDRRWTWEDRHDLPGLSISYRRPTAADGPTDRERFGLPADRPVALAVQTLAKFRPWTDAVHADICAGAPDAVLVFINDHRDAVTRAFRQRLGAAFADRGLVLDDHVYFVPRLSGDDWMRLMAVGDLFLDGLGWSGGNTSLEALAVGLPCLAFPGETMRGRHTLAMVHELGLDELAARDTPDFVARAAALLGDRAGRARLREQILDRVDDLYNDRRGVRALEDVITERLSAARRLG